MRGRPARKSLPWNQGRAVLAQARRTTVRHAQDIVRRVLELHPRDRAAQRRAITRWANILRANDPRVAEQLLSMRVGAGRPEGT